MSTTLSINQQEIPAGTIQRFKLPVGKLPSGTKIDIPGYVSTAMAEGPTVLITGGLHGDEVNGVEIVRQLITRGILDRISKGAVIAMPIINIYGFINFSRDMPDGKDVNRSFPGLARGSLASRIAHLMSYTMIPLTDYIIDFHTGGASRYNHPQIRYTKNDPESKKLAEAFSAPYALAKGLIPNSFRKTCRLNEKPVIVFEGGESLRLDGQSIEEGINGVMRVLQSLDMLETAPTAKASLHFHKTSWIRASHAGIFKWIKKSGQPVVKKEKIGVIEDPFGESIAFVAAHKNGHIIGQNNNPVVNQGDALFNIAYG